MIPGQREEDVPWLKEDDTRAAGGLPLRSKAKVDLELQNNFTSFVIKKKKERKKRIYIL